MVVTQSKAYKQKWGDRCREVGWTVIECPHDSGTPQEVLIAELDVKVMLLLCPRCRAVVEAKLLREIMRDAAHDKVHEWLA